MTPWDLKDFKSQFPLTCLDSGFSNCRFTQIEIWTSFESQFSRPVWAQDFQTVEWPIEIWKVSNPNFPRLIWTQDFQTVDLPKLRFGQVLNPNFPNLLGLKISKPSDDPLRFERFQIPISPDLFGLRISKPSVYPNWDLDKFRVPIFPTCLDLGFPNRRMTNFPRPCLDSGFPNRRFTHWDLNKFQIPIFLRPIWTQDFQTIGLPKLRFGQVSNPNFSPAYLDSGFPNWCGSPKFTNFPWPVWTQDFQTVGSLQIDM